MPSSMNVHPAIPPISLSTLSLLEPGAKIEITQEQMEVFLSAMGMGIQPALPPPIAPLPPTESSKIPQIPVLQNNIPEMFAASQETALHVALESGRRSDPVALQGSTGPTADTSALLNLALLGANTGIFPPASLMGNFMLPPLIPQLSSTAGSMPPIPVTGETAATTSSASQLLNPKLLEVNNNIISPISDIGKGKLSMSLTPRHHSARGSNGKPFQLATSSAETLFSASSSMVGITPEIFSSIPGFGNSAIPFASQFDFVGKNGVKPPRLVSSSFELTASEISSLLGSNTNVFRPTPIMGSSAVSSTSQLLHTGKRDGIPPQPASAFAPPTTSGASSMIGNDTDILSSISVMGTFPMPLTHQKPRPSRRNGKKVEHPTDSSADLDALNTTLLSQLAVLGNSFLPPMPNLLSPPLPSTAPEAGLQLVEDDSSVEQPICLSVSGANRDSTESMPVLEDATLSLASQAHRLSLGEINLNGSSENSNPSLLTPMPVLKKFSFSLATSETQPEVIRQSDIEKPQEPVTAASVSQTQPPVFETSSGIFSTTPIPLNIMPPLINQHSVEEHHEQPAGRRSPSTFTPLEAEIMRAAAKLGITDTSILDLSCEQWEYVNSQMIKTEQPTTSASSQPAVAISSNFIVPPLGSLSLFQQALPNITNESHEGNHLDSTRAAVSALSPLDSLAMLGNNNNYFPSTAIEKKFSIEPQSTQQNVVEKSRRKEAPSHYFSTQPLRKHGEHQRPKSNDRSHRAAPYIPPTRNYELNERGRRMKIANRTDSQPIPVLMNQQPQNQYGTPSKNEVQQRKIPVITLNDEPETVSSSSPQPTGNIKNWMTPTTSRPPPRQIGRSTKKRERRSRDSHFSTLTDGPCTSSTSSQQPMETFPFLPFPSTSGLNMFFPSNIPGTSQPSSARMPTPSTLKHSQREDESAFDPYKLMPLGSPLSKKRKSVDSTPTNPTATNFRKVSFPACDPAVFVEHYMVAIHNFCEELQKNKEQTASTSENSDEQPEVETESKKRSHESEPSEPVACESPDIIIYEGPMPKKKFDAALMMQLDQIKQEPEDDYDYTMAQELAKKNAEKEESEKKDNVESEKESQAETEKKEKEGTSSSPAEPSEAPQVDSTAGDAAPVEEGTTPTDVKAPEIEVTPPVPPVPVLTPNEQRYKKLEESFLEWKFNTVTESYLEFLKEAQLIRHIIYLLSNFARTEAIDTIERKFAAMAELAMKDLTPEQKMKLVSLGLQKEAEMDKQMHDATSHVLRAILFLMYVTEVKNPDLEPILKYPDVTLPTYAVIQETLQEAFNKVEITDLTPDQKTELLNVFKADWKCPMLDRELLSTMSRKAGIKQLNAFLFIQDARSYLRNMITSRNYYWSIDNELPSFN